MATIVAQVRPSVVRIDTDMGVGSGVIFETNASDQSAILLTNYHVIESASLIRVLVNDSLTYTGTLLGLDVQRDLGIL